MLTCQIFTTSRKLWICKLCNKCNKISSADGTNRIYVSKGYQSKTELLFMLGMIKESLLLNLVR